MLGAGEDTFAIGDLRRTGAQLVDISLAPLPITPLGDFNADRITVAGTDKADALKLTGKVVTSGTATLTGLPWTVNVSHAESVRHARDRRRRRQGHARRPAFTQNAIGVDVRRLAHAHYGLAEHEHVPATEPCPADEAAVEQRPVARVEIADQAEARPDRDLGVPAGDRVVVAERRRRRRRRGRAPSGRGRRAATRCPPATRPRTARRRAPPALGQVPDRVLDARRRAPTRRAPRASPCSDGRRHRRRGGRGALAREAAPHASSHPGAPRGHSGPCCDGRACSPSTG